MKNLKFALAMAAVVLTTYSCIKNEKNVTSPVFTTPVTFSAKSSTSMVISWAASDDTTAAADLSYKAVYSLSDNISTESDVEANGTVLQDWALNTTTANMTSLTPVTTYYVTVLARDKDSNTTLSNASASTLCGGKVIFLASVANGNLGGVASADATCAAQRPAGLTGTFKAMLTDGTSRRACYVSGNDNCSSSTTGRAGWVLGASQTLCTSDYAKVVGTTNANALLLVPNPNSLSSTLSAVYTGFNSAWGSSASTCSGFTDAGGSANLGIPNGTENGSTVHTFITNGVGGCGGSGSIYCVEQ